MRKSKNGTNNMVFIKQNIHTYIDTQDKCYGLNIEPRSILNEELLLLTYCSQH